MEPSPPSSPDPILSWLTSTCREDQPLERHSTPPPSRHRRVSFNTPPRTASEPIFSPKHAQLDTPGTHWSHTDSSRPPTSYSSCLSDPPELSEGSEASEPLIDPNTPPVDLRSQEDIELIKSLGRRELLPTPCLQCVLASLPCDYKMPYCSRCIRNSSTCLAQRPCFHNEKECLGVGLLNGFTLLRLWENDEEWGRKRAVEEKLMDELRGMVDKANWVVPSVLSVRGGFRSELLWKEGVVVAMKRGAKSHALLRDRAR